MGIGTRALGAVLMMAAVLGVGCSGPSTEIAARPIAVMMGDLAFDPSVIQMQSDEHVRLAFSNGGGQVHDFTVQEMPMRGLKTVGGMSTGEHATMGAAMHLALAPGSSGDVTLSPTKPGRYTYYCAVAGHREAGMQGVIEVD